MMVLSNGVGFSQKKTSLSCFVFKQGGFDDMMHFQPVPGSQPEEVQEPGETSWNYAEVFADGVWAPVDTFLGTVMRLDQMFLAAQPSINTEC